MINKNKLVKEMRDNHRFTDEVERLIPDYFYPAFAGELISVFGWKWAQTAFSAWSPDYDEESDIAESLLTPEDYSEPIYDLDSNSSGWAAALVSTFKRLKMIEIANLYLSFEWFEADLFNDIIEDRIVDRFINNGQYDNSYYGHIINTNLNLEDFLK